MKKVNVQDERIILERRKIQSDAYSLIVAVLLISVIVQQFFLDASFSQYAVEFFILIGCGLFNLVRHFKKGISLWGSLDEATGAKGKLRLLLDCALTGVISVVLLAVLRGALIPRDVLIYFVCFTVSFYVMRRLMIAATRKRQREIDKMLDLDDEEPL